MLYGELKYRKMMKSAEWLSLLGCSVDSNHDFDYYTLIRIARKCHIIMSVGNELSICSVGKPGTFMGKHSPELSYSQRREWPGLSQTSATMRDDWVSHRLCHQPPITLHGM